jgi:hypothetical protein
MQLIDRTTKYMLPSLIFAIIMAAVTAFAAFTKLIYNLLISIL